jgi:copper chaperone CopZ
MGAFILQCHGRGQLPSLISVLFTLTVVAAPLCAEFLHIEQSLTGLDCASCAQSVDKSFKKIKGVETATFRMEDSVVVLQLKPGNTVPLEEVRDAVKRIGYTPKEAKVTVRGEARREGEKWLFRVAGSAAEYALDISAGEGISDQVRRSAGGIAIIEGSIAADRGASLKVGSARRGE